MKYAVSCMLLLCTASHLIAQTQPAPAAKPSYTISADPSKIFLSTIDLGLERKMSDHASLSVRGSGGYRKVTLWEGMQGRYIMYGGRLEFRHYFHQKEGFLRGPYCGAFLNAYNASFFTTIGEKRYKVVGSSGITPGLQGGWKFNISSKWPGVTLDLQLGAGYRIASISGKYATKSRSVIFEDRGIVPAFAVNMGYTIGARKPVQPPATSNARATAAHREIGFHNQQYDRHSRKKVEKLLKKAGFNPGRPDGKFTEQTIIAIRSFQYKNGLTPDGLVGKGTARKLGLNIN